MKKFFVLIAVLSFGSSVFAKSTYNYKLPLPGATKANAKLQGDTLLPVYTSATSKMPNCGKLSIVDTAVLKQPYNTKSENGKIIEATWKEQWTVKGCGQNVYVPVNFIMENGGTTYMINQKDVHF